MADINSTSPSLPFTTKDQLPSSKPANTPISSSTHTAAATVWWADLPQGVSLLGFLYCDFTLQFLQADDARVLRQVMLFIGTLCFLAGVIAYWICHTSDLAGMTSFLVILTYCIFMFGSTTLTVYCCLHSLLFHN